MLHPTAGGVRVDGGPGGGAGDIRGLTSSRSIEDGSHVGVGAQRLDFSAYIEAMWSSSLFIPTVAIVTFLLVSSSSQQPAATRMKDEFEEDARRASGKPAD
jgi:hypothetical protein